jgi:hypothetical protein
MVNQRSPGQKLLPIAVDEKFISELDAGLVRAGYRNRSQFIRDAIVEKLMRAGVSVPAELAQPPRRIGRKGGTPAEHHHPQSHSSGAELNGRAESRKRRAK